MSAPSPKTTSPNGISAVQKNVDERKFTEDTYKGFRESMGTEMVDIYVGPEKAHFRVHKNLLCTKIPYFDMMFNSGFKEAIGNEAHMPEDDAASFEILIEWVYFGTLRPLTSTRKSGGVWISSYSTIFLYALADKLCLPELMDATLDNHVDRQQKNNVFDGIIDLQKIYVRLPVGSQYRYYACHELYYILHELRSPQIDEKWRTDEIAEMLYSNKDIASELVKFIRSQPVGERIKDPRTLPRCHFHQHGETGTCYKDSGKCKRKRSDSEG